MFELFPAPVAIDGQQLVQDLHDAGFIDVCETDVHLVDGEVRICGIAAADAVAVGTVVAAHVPVSRHRPLDPLGRLITLLSIYEGGTIPPCEELVKMVDGLTVEDVQAEFSAWVEAGEAP
jgi:hypothetical protein